MTVESLKDCNKKYLAQLAKDQGIAGWHTMRKDQLIRALSVAPAAPIPRAGAACASIYRRADRSVAMDLDFEELVIPVGEWDKAVLLGYEREMLGLYVSDHPLFGIEHVIAGQRRDTHA